MVSRAIFAAKVSVLVVIVYIMYRILVQRFVFDSVDKIVSLGVDSLIAFAVVFCIVFVIYSVFR